MYTFFIILLSLLPLFSASPITTEDHQLTKRQFGPYSITNFATGCLALNCVYQFSITYDADSAASGEPNFSTICVGLITQEELRPCADPSISAGPANGSIVVKHEWMRGPAQIWVQGHLDMSSCGACDGEVFSMRVDSSHALVPV